MIALELHQEIERRGLCARKAPDLVRRLFDEPLQRRLDAHVDLVGGNVGRADHDVVRDPAYFAQRSRKRDPSRIHPDVGDDDTALALQGTDDALIQLGILGRVAASLPSGAPVMQVLKRGMRMDIQVDLFGASESRHGRLAMIHPDNCKMEIGHRKPPEPQKGVSVRARRPRLFAELSRRPVRPKALELGFKHATSAPTALLLPEPLPINTTSCGGTRALATSS